MPAPLPAPHLATPIAPGRNRRAVFLDRDGVLNRNVFYPDTGAWESPRHARKFELVGGVLPALARMRDAGFLLFLVSNQPNAAKGKSSPDALQAMHALLAAAMEASNLRFSGVFYCTHHPAFTGPCICRKPSPYFLVQAAHAHSLDLAQCWMVGDRATDMECGRAAGTHTAWIRTGQERQVPSPELVDIRGADLGDVAGQILDATCTHASKRGIQAP